jgi:hypothetical protein
MRDSNFDKALIEFYMKHVSSSLQHAHMKIICELLIEITYLSTCFVSICRNLRALNGKDVVKWPLLRSFPLWTKRSGSC